MKAVNQTNFTPGVNKSMHYFATYEMYAKYVMLYYTYSMCYPIKYYLFQR